MLDRRELLKVLALAGATELPVDAQSIEPANPLFITLTVREGVELTDAQWDKVLACGREIGRRTKLPCMILPGYLIVAVQEDPRIKDAK
jgi:hypothetical protein